MVVGFFETPHVVFFWKHTTALVLFGVIDDEGERMEGIMYISMINSIVDL